jgi:glycosyltransferase involved in cell wall biosynthesis
MTSYSTSARVLESPQEQSPAPSSQTAQISAALMTAGYDHHYACGLANTLAEKDVCVEVIGGGEVDGRGLVSLPTLKLLNLRGPEPGSLWGRVVRITTYYRRLLRYALVAQPRIFHILWNNRFQYFDRTLLTLYYKACGRKIVLTAHNVNTAERDARDSWLNRLTLRIQYQLADHIFVHTERMKSELVGSFGVDAAKATVIPFGINDAVPETGLHPAAARRRLGIQEGEKTLLFFGNIAPYKGLEYLVAAFEQVAAGDPAYRLIVAGPPKEGFEEYVSNIRRMLGEGYCRARALARIDYVPDDEVEVYFKAADVLVLPYTHIFQSGVLVLGYRFGVPVLASNVGSLRDDILEGKTGLVCKPADSADLARAIERFFNGDLFRQREAARKDIRDYARRRYSWDVVGTMTRKAYSSLLGE